jgi:PAS domain S-box-containing protein
MVALRTGTRVRGVVMGVWVPSEDRRRWLRIDAVPVLPPGGGAPVGACAMFDDVSRQREADELLEAVLDAIPDVIGVQDVHHRILRYNRAGHALLGPPEAVNGRRCHELIGRDAPCARCASREAIDTGRVVRMERVVPELDRIYEVSAYPIQDPDGLVTRVVEHLRDVTAERRALEERDHLREKLLHAQKLEAVGRLAGGVAHDFNNLLTAIGGFAELLLLDLAEGQPGRADAQEILRAANRATALTRQLLAFSRRQVLAPVRLDLNAVLRDMHRMLRRLLGEDVRLELALAPDLWPVWADAGQVEQVLANLATNARDALPRGGTLAVVTENVAVDEATARSHPDATAGDHVRLRVRDDGEGMDASTRAHLFEPFFTTKPRGKGTGLGLSTVYGIVTQLGGFLEVRSRPGEGCEVEVHLPRAGAAAPAGIARAPGPGPAPGGRAHVLLVEDEEQVRDLTRRFLESLGYRVHALADAAAALRWLDATPGLVPEVLVTDVVLPGMSGPELARALRERWPGLRVLLVTGWAESLAGSGRLDGPDGLPLLLKPFTRDALARALREVLEAPEGH